MKWLLDKDFCAILQTNVQSLLQHVFYSIVNIFVCSVFRRSVRLFRSPIQMRSGPTNHSPAFVLTPSARKQLILYQFFLIFLSFVPLKLEEIFILLGFISPRTILNPCLVSFPNHLLSTLRFSLSNNPGAYTYSLKQYGLMSRTLLSGKNAEI